MLIRITVRSTITQEEVTTEAECQKEGDVNNGVAALLKSFRVRFPENPPFEWKLSVEKANA